MTWTVVQILEKLEAVISILKGKTSELTAKDAFNKLFGMNDFEELEPDEVPNQAQALRVIDKLTELVQAQQVGKKGLFEKNSGLAAKRLRALQIVRERLATPKQQEESVYFKGVNLNRLGVHLGLRVVKPRAISQGEFGLCGPVTILYPLNKTEPEQYVNYVLGLAERGIGRLGLKDINVQDSTTLLGSSYSKDHISEVDYVALASLRTDVGTAIGQNGFSVENPTDTHSHATTPEQMKLALVSAGYCHVEDKTFDYKKTQDPWSAYNRLKECEQRLNQKHGYVVIMLVHADLAHYAKRGTNITGTTENLKLGDLHWMVVKDLKISDSSPKTGTATMKVVTWRWSGFTTYQMVDFLPRFFGYLEADPTAINVSAREFKEKE